MPASQENTDLSYLAAFNAMNTPMPSPFHFGEIDVATPFDPHRYFTMLRCAGVNPYLWRHGEQGVMYCSGGNRPGFLHGPSELHKRLFYEAMAWANAQDKDSNIRNSFMSEIKKTKPDGNFIHYLGC
jgi:hypothetical protein